MINLIAHLLTSLYLCSSRLSQVVRNKLDHRLSFREQSQHMGELRHVPVSIEAKTSGWFRSIECPHLHWTEASVKFNVVGSANNDVIEVYWHNGRQRSECLGLPAGYTCSVAFDYHRKFITYTIDRAVN